jgi:hypothetical protein
LVRKGGLLTRAAKHPRVPPGREIREGWAGAAELKRQTRFSTEEKPTDEGTILSQCQKAAADGFAAAPFALGMAYRHGDGAEKDDHSAYYWLTLAERNAEQIALSSRNVLDELRKSMRAEEIQEVESSIATGELNRRKAKDVLNLVNKCHSIPSSLAV